MICLRFEDTVMAPPAGALLGTSGSSQILQQINSQWANAGVIFGQANDPRTNRYAAFMNTVVTPINAVAKIVENTSKILFNPNHIYAVTNEDMLQAVPPALQIPILTCPEIRGYLNQGKLFGWGIDASSLPSEDIAGRLIDNGSAYLTHPDKDLNKNYLEWTWRSDDPNYSADDLDAISESRTFFVSYIRSQMAKDAKHLDATNYLHPMPGRLKK